MGEYTHIKHTFEPVYDSRSRLLILGSLPSVKSREEGFYYGNPHNRFWKVISAVAEKPLPVSIDEKKSMLLESGIAVWDVIYECDIIGSNDASIKNVVPADIPRLLADSGIKAVYANGGTAAALYNKLLRDKTGMDIIKLPSTSPANAAWSVERLTGVWREMILPVLKI